VWNGLDQSFGQLGVPQVAVNVLGNVSDPDGVASIRYSLNGAPDVTLRMGPDSRRLAKLGDFNVELPVTGLDNGANTLRLTATDSVGEVRVVDVDVNFAAGNVWPTPYSVDWSTASEINDVAQIVDGKWAFENGGVRTVEPAYDRIIAIGDVSWTNYEVTLPVTINGFDESGFSSPVSGRAAGLGLLVRWAGATDKPVVSAQPKSGWLPHGAIGWWWWQSPTSARLELTANGSLLQRTPYGTAPAVGSTLMYKMRVETDQVGVTRYSLKVWPSTQSEPATWNLAGSDKPGDPQMGSIVLLAHHVDATFGDVTVTPLGANPSGYAVDVSTSGSGVVAVSPDRQQYAYGDDATLTATPDAGWVFTGWSGDITSTVNPLTVSLTSSVAVTANFVSESDAPVISNVAVTPFGESARLTWTTDKQTTGSIAYGTTSAYELGSVDSAVLSTSHSVNISGLSPATTYHFRVTAEDQFGNVSQTPDATFTTRNAGLSGVVSDDFNACAVDGAVWSFVDPVGDGSATVNGTQLELSVPGGVSHDVWTGGNFAPRLMQPLNDVDVELAAKFDSTVFDAFEMQGWIIEQDPQNFLRFDVYGTGAGQGLFVAKFVNGSPQALVSTPVSAPGPVWLRVGRVGDVWTLAWSVDGVSWTTAASFVHAMSVTQAGVFAGNAGGSPAHTAVIDYVFDTAEPILDEDADAVICIGGVSVERFEDSAVVSWSTGTPTTGSVAWGTSSAYGSGPVVSSTPATSHSVTLSGLDPATVYHYQVTATDTSGNSTATPDATFTTSTSGLLAFEVDRLVTTADRGFPWNQPPMASANGDWTSPIDYAGGRLHFRAEIKAGGQPVAKSIKLQFCVWQDALTKETCSSTRTIVGSPGNVVEWSEQISTMWKKDGVPIDWTRARQRYGIAIKNMDNNPVSDFSGWNWFGEDPAEWYPLDLRFTVRAVPAGQTFAGW
jgi:hypothetical protein